MGSNRLNCQRFADHIDLTTADEENNGDYVNANKVIYIKD